MRFWITQGAWLANRDERPASGWISSSGAEVQRDAESATLEAPVAQPFSEATIGLPSLAMAAWVTDCTQARCSTRASTPSRA
jgi:hypothetical protein